jgi:hypothetical protein
MSVSDVGPTSSVEGVEKCRCLGCDTDVPIGLKVRYCAHCKTKCIEPEERRARRRFSFYTVVFWFWVWLAGLLGGMIWGLLKRGFASGAEVVDKTDDSMPMWDEKEHHNS